MFHNTPYRKWRLYACEVDCETAFTLFTKRFSLRAKSSDQARSKAMREAYSKCYQIIKVRVSRVT